MVRDVIGTIARIGLAGIWLVSGVLKALEPEQTYLAVAAYDVLPTGLVDPVATALPFLEIALGVLLLVGFGTRAVAVTSAAVLLVFIAGVVQAWARGLSIDCGCFGGGGEVAPGETRYPQELARDLGFLLLAAWLVVRPRTLFAVQPVPASSGRSAAEGAEPPAGPVVAEDGIR
ncbi:MAG TPA: MauE/DoxX family redox-associated membrane protein [Pseudonocardiaceae bacterium]